MYLLKLIYFTAIHLVKQAWALLSFTTSAVKRGRLLEAERLDRIRNPSKYRGKG